MKKRTILCIDDEAIILLALKQELKLHFRDRYTIATALNVEQAKQMLETIQKEGRTVELIICDWLMPGTKGDTFLAELRTQNPKWKLMVITGHADQDAIETFQEKVKARILYKPWKSEDLITTVTELLEE
ncbi:MAG: response regulator [Spirochaetes bacterium]|nr:response regulator [Spirochaetota bacterium]